ncbi:MAG: GHKL domain-containing protein [Caldimicrobium sp.]|jgi:signal transduction histidine kinase|nr:GHKL domain-containing protein [Caldimicrobium sp.]
MLKYIKPQSIRGQFFLISLVSFSSTIIAIILFYSIFTFLRSSIEFILFSNSISTLVDNILEMRRHEKNYLLYNNNKELENIVNLISISQDELTKNEKEYKTFLGNNMYNLIQNDLLEYNQIVNKIINGKCENKQCLQDLRNKGSILTQHAENIRDLKDNKLRGSVRIVVYGFIMIIFLSFIINIFITYYLSLHIVKPFKKIEEYLIMLKKGEISQIPNQFNDREFVILVNSMNDMISEIEKRNQYLIQTEKLATLGTFLFALAHELNNPLNNIYTSCQILKEELKENNVSCNLFEEMLNEMENEIERIKRIIKSILDYSKPGTKEEVYLYDLIEEFMLCFHKLIPPQIKVSVEVPENIVIFVDPQQIKQALLNIITNAVDAIEGEGEIKIKAEETENQAILYVSDTGKGIPANILPKIFEPFFTTKESGKGYGLGLFIVYHLIKSNGGTIEVESEVGKGTTFIIKLPKKGGD